MRATEGADASQHFKKVYGEILDGGNRHEPGNGWPVFTLNRNLFRKISPITRVWPSWWPATMQFVNDSVANIRDYYYRFFQANGADVTDYTTQPFAGVRWSDTSFTFEDGTFRQVIAAIPPSNLSARVDHEVRSIKGIDTIGDPIYEWGLGFPLPPQ